MQEIEEVNAGAFRLVLRYLYTSELPESTEGGSSAGGGGLSGCGGRGGKEKEISGGT